MLATQSFMNQLYTADADQKGDGLLPKPIFKNDTNILQSTSQPH